jgi:hypothetical protein
LLYHWWWNHLSNFVSPFQFSTFQLQLWKASLMRHLASVTIDPKKLSDDSMGKYILSLQCPPSKTWLLYMPRTSTCNQSAMRLVKKIHMALARSW